MAENTQSCRDHTVSHLLPFAANCQTVVPALALVLAALAALEVVEVADVVDCGIAVAGEGSAYRASTKADASRNCIQAPLAT